MRQADGMVENALLMAKDPLFMGATPADTLLSALYLTIYAALLPLHTDM